MTKPAAVIDWLRTQLGTADIRMTKLPGATSSSVFRVDAREASYVLRLFDASVWLEQLTDLPGREARILGTLSNSGVPAPKLIASASADSAIGAAVLMSHLPGRVVLPQAPGATWLGELARGLADIHQRDIPALPWQFRSWQHMTGRAAPDWFIDEALWRNVQRAITKSPTPADVRLLHRDYHPVNVLWSGRTITGVVDWVNACLGPAGVDVAHCRLNLALMYDMTAADAFLAAYQRQRPGYRHAPYWDVDDALGVLPDVEPYAPWETFGMTLPSTGEIRQRLLSFVRGALASESAQ